jgi:hypothetical protein
MNFKTKAFASDFKTKAFASVYRRSKDFEFFRDAQTFIIDVPRQKRVLNFSFGDYLPKKLFLDLPRMHFYVFFYPCGKVYSVNSGIVFVRNDQYYYPKFTNVQKTYHLNICGLESSATIKEPFDFNSMRDAAYDRLKAFYQSSFTLSNTDMFKLYSPKIIHAPVWENPIAFFEDWSQASKSDDEFKKFEDRLFSVELNNYSGNTIMIGNKDFFDVYKSQLTGFFD